MLSSEPNWIMTAAMGALMGAAISPLWNSLRYLSRRQQRHSMAGLWFTYHFTRINNLEVLRYGTLSIRNGVTSRYIARRLSCGVAPNEHGEFSAPTVEYKGPVTEELSHHLMVLGSTSHQETSMWRFIRQVRTNDHQIFGLALSYDYDGNPTASAVLLSRKQLTDDAAIALIKARTTMGDLSISARPSAILPPP
jgi:hypothetical protein